MNKRQLTTQIDKFLADKKKCEGTGWAPVTPAELDQLYKIVWGLIDLKYQRDVDGDSPVNVSLIDRTKYHGSPYLNMPYAHLLKTDEEIDNLMHCAITNLKISTDDLQQVLFELAKRGRKL